MRQLLLFILCPLSIFSQNTIGLPDVINYPKQDYNAGLQNWDIEQDINGINYIANNEGLLTYDGKYWNIYALPKRTNVRSVEIGADNRVYVGGQDEIGYFAPAKNGRLEYHSLTPLITPEDRTFGDIWNIVVMEKEIFFRSSNKIFRFKNEHCTTFNPPSEWMYLEACNKKLYAQDNKAGLMVFENNIWKPLSPNNALLQNEKVTSILPIKGENALITTLKNGLLLLSANGITKIESVNNQLFEKNRINAATKVTNDWIALATIYGGVYIIDLQGSVIQHFSRIEGLQNNNVLSIFLDRQKNLWLGLENGIDFINYNSAIKNITPLSQNSPGYAAIIYDNKLFIGISNGLYSAPLQPFKDLSFSKGEFTAVENTGGQTWNLSAINNELLLGHNDGAFVIKNNTATPLSNSTGFWNFMPINFKDSLKKLIAGTYKGLLLFDYLQNKFVAAGQVKGFYESSRYVAIDGANNIWVSHPYHGVFRIAKNDAGNFESHLYADKQGLPSLLSNHVFSIKNEIVIGSEKGIFTYNRSTDRFEQDSFYYRMLGNKSIRYLKEDNDGNVWFIYGKILGVIDYSGNKPQVIYLPELNNKMQSGYEFIYAINENNIFLAGEKGFYHINYEKYKKNTPELQVQIRSVQIFGKKDSLIFGGYFSNVNEKQIQDANHVPQIPYNLKTIRFEFSSPSHGYQSNLEYSYRLSGFDEKWSEWTKRTEKEYSNLRAGKYLFEIKVRSNLGIESAVTVYKFIIPAPWYQTVWVYLLSLLIFSAGLSAIIKWQKRKFKLQQHLHEEEQKRLSYIHELEINKTESELVTVRNEKLEADINFKNSELASSAMHLVKKGELLTKIKTELSQVTKQMDNNNINNELKKVIKTLGEDDNIDKEWENFTKHFDKVQGDFITLLKEKHPSITGSEVKICAYLRMNLSTKEIAQLLNISVRGVDISRYRLRKKLQITSETSLFDYLIKIKPKA